DQFARLFPDEPLTLSLQLLQGFENANVHINAAIWKLAQHALGQPEILTSLQANASKVGLRQLRQQRFATEFFEMFDCLLSRWGNRIVGPNDFAHPSWKEDQTFVVHAVVNYAQTQRNDPMAELSRLSQHRIDEETRLLAQLATRPSDQTEFIRLLRRAQT